MNELHELMIDQDGVTVEGKKQFPEIDNLQNGLNDMNKEIEECKDRGQKIEIVTDQIYGWAQKVLQKMIEHFSDGRIDIPDLGDLEKLKSNTVLVELFEKISDTACDQLEQLIADEVSDEDRYITLKDFLNDFASQDFVHKNIRVRPMSARTNADESQRQEYGAGGPTRNLGKSNDGPKEDQNDVRSMLYEIEQQRKMIKEKHSEIRRKEKEKKEKK